MRHVIVTRVVGLLSALFLICAVAFAWIAESNASAPRPQAPGAGDDAVLFDRYCASCHEAEDLRREVGAGGDARRRALETFLDDHGEAPAADDRLILDYLIRSGGS